MTDQPRARPEAPLPPAKRQKHVILSLSVPSGNPQDTADLVTVLFPFIDAFSAINLRPETKSKLKKAREELDKSLKADSEKEKKEEVRSVVALVVITYLTFPEVDPSR